MKTSSLRFYMPIMLILDSFIFFCLIFLLQFTHNYRRSIKISEFQHPFTKLQYSGLDVFLGHLANLWASRGRCQSWMINMSCIFILELNLNLEFGAFVSSIFSSWSWAVGLQGKSGLKVHSYSALHLWLEMMSGSEVDIFTGLGPECDRFSFYVFSYFLRFCKRQTQTHLPRSQTMTFPICFLGELKPNLMVRDWWPFPLDYTSLVREQILPKLDILFEGSLSDIQYVTMA